MKTLILFASPNKMGRTNRLLEEYLKSANIEGEIVNLYESNIAPCIDCGFCSSKNGECSIKDDMTELYEKLQKYENIIIASPMYFGMFPSPLIALINRVQVLWCKKYVFNEVIEKKRKGILVITAGNEWEGMLEPMTKVGKYFYNTIGCELKDIVFIPNTDRENVNQLSIEIKEEALRKAEKFRDF
ncbi:flavodoxin family protein [Oceanirhabdus sp. W0125-5]|uniref:flavodoxin family protein n=1 Tax=Oceanirhabdus sp. W0125-5 TaxID=2999116 RepID=UPI0022F2FF39|nr:flavodoxin family protein [Oceanirhabdus sp. W0125-5]WBW96008.1 flavodoxin family protein [Oceanirhabdus sp. W0125-5]